MAAERPSILWIVTTQWRAQACGYAGDRNARTPALDAFAATCTDFPQAVTPHPFGPFARAALLTGVPSPENGVCDYFDPLPIHAPGRADHGPDRGGARVPGRTVAHELDERGYATGFFGKWHLGRRDPDEPLVGEAHAKTIVPAGARGGFSHWEGFESGFLLNDPWLHGSAMEHPTRFRGYQSDILCERAADWCRARTTSGPGAPPWFCVVSLEPPHPPYDAAAGGIRPHDAAELDLRGNVPAGGAVEAKARSELAGYYAHIEATDRSVGRLIAAVDGVEAAAGRPAPAIVFTSVHGDMHGAHGLFRKGWPHEESVRVPLLVRAPGPAFAAGRNEASVSLLELARWTLAWAVGSKVEPAQTFSRLSMPSVVALPHQCDRIWRGVRTPQRKLVLNADGSPWLLFDLENDPLELRNLSADPAWRDEIERLRKRV